MPHDVRITALITGSVQAVGYRAFVRRHALDLHLSGYAENLSDGRVEVVAEGDRDDLEAFVHQLKRGPAHADVSAVEVQWTEASGLRGFYAH